MRKIKQINARSFSCNTLVSRLILIVKYFACVIFAQLPSPINFWQLCLPASSLVPHEPKVENKSPAFLFLRKTSSGFCHALSSYFIYSLSISSRLQSAPLNKGTLPWLCAQLLELTHQLLENFLRQNPQTKQIWAPNKLNERMPITHLSASRAPGVKSRSRENFSRAYLGCVDGPFVYTCEGGSWPRLVHFSSSPALYIQLITTKRATYWSMYRVPDHR